MAKVAIVGCGWVGTNVGMGFRSMGYEVIFYDIVPKDLPNFTMDVRYAVNNSEVCFICVPTPTTRRGIDLSYIKDASAKVGKALRSAGNYYVVVIKSTILPGTTENVLIPLLERFSNKKVGKDFGVCVNPEFMTEIEHSWTDNQAYKKDFFTEDRVVIGEYDKRSGDVLYQLYKPLNKPVFRVNLKTAEMIKYAANCMLATKISYWNEIFLICRESSINSQVVAEIVGLDPRIGKYGTVHGKAFGGKCLPKDLKAFIKFVQKYRKPKILKAVDEINEEMKEKFGVRE
ncbi:MAG: nucleotide sugar dehydrogenase [Candidatus Bathyarchaeia archaeon]